MNRDAIEKELSRQLLEIKAVFIRTEEPFTWASGIKSPIYCDNRLTLSYPEIRDFIEDAIAETVKTVYPECEMLMGTSTAGIPHAAIAAHLLGIPMGYVRGSAKDHGRNNRIEGHLEEGTKVVIIEDLISTAGSVIETAEALREAGADVLGVVSIFTYDLAKGRENLRAADLLNTSLIDLDTLAEVAVAEGYLTETDQKRLLAFRDDPEDESWLSL